MLKQNIEADFETDEEQIRKANEMMRTELIESISYCVTQDPLTLVNNIRYHDPNFLKWNRYLKWHGSVNSEKSDQ